ncbi:MAG: flagellar basal body P-ring formation chaperone FlgA [Limisphaerales bacterium]
MMSKKALFALLISLSPMMSWGQAGSAAEPTAWKLLSQAQVDGSGVFLDELAVASDTTQVLPHVRLARPPHAGQAVTFSRSDVAGLAQSCQAGLVVTNWSGAMAVRVSRRVRVLEDSDLLDLLTTTLQKQQVKNQGELELRLARPGPKPLVPDEPLTLKVTEMPSTGLSPSFVVSFELWDGKERVGNWQAAVQAAVWRDVPVARSTLERGQSLKDADVTMERSDVLTQRDALMNFPTSNDTLELSEGVPAGKPILSRYIHARPLVRRGEMVEGVYQEGSLGISLLVEALEDGSLGQTVRVRNPKTRRELNGIVENEKTIRINL